MRHDGETTNAMPGGSRDWLADRGTWFTLLNVMLLAVYLVWTPYHWGGKENVALISDLAAVWFGFALVYLSWRVSTSAMQTRRTRLGWWLFTLAFFADLSGNVIWTYYDVVLEIEPWPSLADIGYLAFYPLVLAGLLCFKIELPDKTERYQFWLDAIIVVTGAGTVIWYFLLRTIATVEYNNTLELVLSEAYPVGDILLLFGVTTLILKRPLHYSDAGLAWLIAGIICMFIADLVFSYQNLQGTYQSGGATDALYVIYYLLLITGCQIEYIMSSRQKLQRIVRTNARHDFSVLPYLVVAIAYGLLLFISRHQWDKPLGGLIIAAIILTALVVARQILTAQAIRETETRFASMVRHSSDVITMLDTDHAIRFISPSAAQVFGHTPERLINTAFMDLVHPDDHARMYSLFSESLAQPGVTSTVVWRLSQSDGSWSYIETVATNFTGEPAVGSFILNSRNVTERKLLEGQLRHLAFHDPLTLLANRTLFCDRLEHALARAGRNEARITVLFIDLDNFKMLNDNLGHVEGDRILKTTAERLIDCTRAADTVARLGGDEFAILLEDMSNLELVAQLAERIVARLQIPVSIEGKDVLITASIGIAQSAGGDNTDADMVLRNADAAMYAVKKRGKCGYAIFSPGMHAT